MIRFVRFLALAAFGLWLLAPAGATSLRRLTLAELVQHSEGVFVGTVSETTVVPGEAPYRLLYTEVTFTDLAWITGGDGLATAVYRFAGGRLGDRRVTVVGMPEFRPGQRIFLFASREGRLSNAVGFSQGVFRIGRDAGTGDEIVLDAFGNPVTGIVDGLPVKGESAASAMRPGELVACVRSLRPGTASEEEDR
jgi:hypothetical protein